MCVVSFATLLVSIPPIARTAPMIASLSPVGISAQEMVTFEKIKAGSGEKGLICASLPFKSDWVIQAGVSTGTM